MFLSLTLCALAAAAPPLVDVPFDDAFGLVFFQATVQGSEPLTFLLDTGFDGSALNDDVATRLGLRVLDSEVSAAPGGSIETARLAPATLGIGGLRVEGVTLARVPLGPLHGVVGRRIDGILGHDVLERYVVEIDYPKSRLRFRAPEGFVHTGAGQVLPVTIQDAQALVPAGILTPAGRAVFGLFKLDTGSLDVAGLNLNFVRDGALTGPGTRELSVGGVAVGGATEGRLFRAAALLFGVQRLEGPVVGYTVDSKGFENRADAGTLGAALLSRYKLILDYPRRRILLEDGPEVGRPVPEDQTGMLVVAAGPALETLVVAQVLPGSPAAAAGLAAGDELVSIGGREGWTLREVRKAQEQAGPLELSIRRAGESHRVTIVRRPLLPRD